MEAVDKALKDDPTAGGHKAAIEDYLRNGLSRLEPDIIKSDWI